MNKKIIKNSKKMINHFIVVPFQFFQTIKRSVLSGDRYHRNE